MTSPTTPRDAIAGLSERLREPIWNEETMKQWDSWRKMIIDLPGASLPRDCFECFLDNVDEERSEAATQLDALQARVKELEARPPLLDAKSLPSVDALVGALESRAARAEQERDEAVTSTRYKIFDNLLGAYIGADDEHIRVAIGNLVYMICPEHREVLREAAEDRRLAAGDEKEK